MSLCFYTPYGFLSILLYCHNETDERLSVPSFVSLFKVIDNQKSITLFFSFHYLVFQVKAINRCTPVIDIEEQEEKLSATRDQQRSPIASPSKTPKLPSIPHTSQSNTKPSNQLPAASLHALRHSYKFRPGISQKSQRQMK